MSRIFDALQRSEGERSGSDSAVLPHGPELLREAERRAATDWETAVSVKEPDAEEFGKKSGDPAPEALSNAIASVAMPAIEHALTGSEREEIFNRFQTLATSIAPESHLACITDHESPTAEAVRLLAVRLRDMRRTRPFKKVLITSTIPREGKSTIAANLACALARKAEEKVLLIEGDVRLPVMLRMFGIAKHPGLCDALRDELNLLDGIYRAADTGIWILPAGEAPSNSLEILQSHKLPLFMEQLAACFDWIIIDSPPILPLADTSVWMRLADGVLLVTRQDITEKRQLQKGLDTLEPDKVLGALLNGSKASKYSGYYYSSSSSS